MKTLAQAAETPGVTVTQDGKGLNCHFSPIPNWYMKTGFDCPRCGNPIDWDWDWGANAKPMITNDFTPSIVKPILTGAKLLAYGHRWIRIECDKCNTQLFPENFD